MMIFLQLCEPFLASTYDRKTEADRSLNRPLEDLAKGSYIAKLFTACCEVKVHSMFCFVFYVAKFSNVQIFIFAYRALI